MGQVGIGTETPVSQLSVQMASEATSYTDTNDGITLLDPNGEILMSLSGSKADGVFLNLPNSGNNLILDGSNLSFTDDYISRAQISCGWSIGQTAPNAVYDASAARYRNRMIDLFYNGSAGWGLGIHDQALEFYKPATGTWQFGYESGNDFHDLLYFGGSTNPFLRFGYAYSAGAQAMSYSISVRTQWKGGFWTNGHLAAEGNVYGQAFNTTSDRRLKSNITSVENGMDVIRQLNPVHYTKQNAVNSENTNEEYGFIAQDIREILPDIVKGVETDTSYLSLDYNSFIPILTRGLQEQDEVIQNQQAQIDQLIAEMKEMRGGDNLHTASMSTKLILTLIAGALLMLLGRRLFTSTKKA